MRSLDAALITELGLTITRPGYLVSIAFDIPLYLSTLGDITFDPGDGEKAWASAPLKVGGLTRDTGAARSCSITLGNAWLDFGAVALNEGVAERPVKVWAVYAGAPTHAALEFSGFGDSLEVGDNVTVGCVAATSANAFAPRRRVCAATGFNVVLPAGTLLKVGGESYTLERA